MADHSRNNLPTTNSSRELSSQSASTVEWRGQTAAILSKLALHYWRPDFNAGQVKQMLGDYFEDLAAFTPADIEAACAAYRRNPENRYFPRAAELLAILKPKSDPMDRGPRLQVFRGYPEPARRATKSVAEVLREHGFNNAADRWGSRK
jgi:hypothetical protein